MPLLERFHNGDIRALSRVISLIEDRQGGYQGLLGKLYRAGGHSVRIGITGPPGAGKSTLVNHLTRVFLAESKKVAIIAVDPTSPFTGGALLGDRVRMSEFPIDGRVYFRSMATRGALGGLSGATDNVAVAADAFGFDYTVIETVGIGQVELDVVDVCDVVVVIIVPESGDAVQTMKAGLMEIASVLVINKADRPGADTLMSDLKLALDLKRRESGGWNEPIIPTVATAGSNIGKLHRAIEDYLTFARDGGLFDRRRRDRIRKKILAIMTYRFQRQFLDGITSQVDIDSIVEDIAAGRTDPYEVGSELWGRFTSTKPST